MTGYRGMDFGFGGLFWGFADRDVEVDWPYMLSCVVVTLGFGLHEVTLGFSSLVNNGPWYILIICRGLEQHFLAGA